MDPGRVVAVEVLDGLVRQDLDQLRRAQQVVEARRQEVVVGHLERERVLQEVDERLRLAGQPVDPNRLVAHEVDQHRDVVRRAGLRTPMSPSNSALSADSRSGGMASSTIATAVSIHGLDQRTDRDVGAESLDVGFGHRGSVRRVAEIVGTVTRHRVGPCPSRRGIGDRRRCAEHRRTCRGSSAAGRSGSGGRSCPTSCRPSARRPCRRWSGRSRR